MEDDAKAVIVHIDDAGRGIPADRIGSVLEPFVRLETSRSRETGGVGLSLTIANTSILANGSTVVLANGPGGGLRASVTQPRVRSTRA